MESKVKKAIDTLCKALKNDDGLYEAYKANIAMAIYDDVRRWKDQHKKKSIPLYAIHECANQGACNFLNLLIKAGQK